MSADKRQIPVERVSERIGSQKAKTILPSWAAGMVPVDMNGAAVLLGICRRTLADLIKSFPLYERRGSKKVFYREHIEALRKELQCLGSDRITETEFSMPLAPLRGNAFDRALALVTNGKRKNSAHNTKPSSGNVVIMAKSPSGRLRKQ